MIFKYFQYISPTWYFNLQPQIDHGYFPNLDQVHDSLPDFELDSNFISKEAQIRDAAFRAFQQGVINRKRGIGGLNVWSKIPKLPAEDEYRFIRKNVSPFWAYYVFIIRIFLFKNPISEILGLRKSRNAKRERYSSISLKHLQYHQFKSNLLKNKPLVSVIIPTLNRYKYLKDVFRDLEKQSYPNFEVIVVDQTEPFDESVYQGWKLDIKYWYQKEKALWKARNDAIKSAQGDFILLYDDDSLVEADWIEHHLRLMDYFQSDISSGVSISAVGAKVPDHYSYFRWSDQLDTGNALIKRSIFEKIGYFDTKFEKQRMGDGEYGLRAYLAGYRNISNPFAKRIHLKVGQGGLRQMGSWDGWRPKKFWGPRPVPSILYLFRKYFGSRPAIWALIKGIPSSFIPYKYKSSKTLMSVFYVFTPVLFLIAAFQVILSWRESSNMLEIK